MLWLHRKIPLGLPKAYAVHRFIFSFFLTVKIKDYCNKEDFGNYSMFPDVFLRDQATTQIVWCLSHSQG